MSYRVMKTECGYKLFEKSSQITIEIGNYNEDSARMLCRKLNLGSGFCGWTPDFLAKKWLIKA